MFKQLVVFVVKLALYLLVLVTDLLGNLVGTT